MRGEQEAQLQHRADKLDAYATEAVSAAHAAKARHAFGSAKSNQRERFNAGDQLARDGQAVANMLTRPSDQAARGYIEHRYGVPAPSPSQPREAVPGWARQTLPATSSTALSLAEGARHTIPRIFNLCCSSCTAACDVEQNLPCPVGAPCHPTHFESSFIE
jgi:hypothetical protein